MSERADGILRCLEEASGSFGIFVGYLPRSQDSQKQTTFYHLLAHSGCTEWGELKFLMDYVIQRGWIETSGGPYNVRLTVDGYEKLENLEQTNIDSSIAFVAMWFDPSMNDAWEKGFRPAIQGAGYDPLRIDQKEHVNKIDDEIIAEIRRARFVVADFTHGYKEVRGGVYYEAGFAHGIKIPVVFTCRADMINDVHFDTRQFNHIRWEDPEKLKDELMNRIAAVIGDGPFMN